MTSHYFIFRSIEDVILSRLSSDQIEILCFQFIDHAFISLDFVATKFKTFSQKPQLLMAIQTATITAIAIFICRSVVALGRSVPSGVRTFSGQIIFKYALGTCPIRVGTEVARSESRLNLDRPNALEILERCDVLRREFGVYVMPTKIPPKQTSADIPIDSGEVDESFERWKKKCNRDAVEEARKMFWELGKTQIEEAADVRGSGVSCFQKTSFSGISVYWSTTEWSTGCPEK